MTTEGEEDERAQNFKSSEALIALVVVLHVIARLWSDWLRAETEQHQVSQTAAITRESPPVKIYSNSKMIL